jgi:hypothetical protein
LGTIKSNLLKNSQFQSLATLFWKLAGKFLLLKLIFWPAQQYEFDMPALVLKKFGGTRNCLKMTIWLHFM